MAGAYWADYSIADSCSPAKRTRPPRSLTIDTVRSGKPAGTVGSGEKVKIKDRPASSAFVDKYPFDSHRPECGCAWLKVN